MNIKSFDDCEQIMDLDINTLEDGKEYDKICYLLNYKAGLTKQDKGFYTFYVKDKNANVVAARMFDVKDYVDEGFTAMLMKSKAVKISFVAQIWNGSWSLVVKNIEIWNGNFSYENYIGKAEYSVDALEAVYESLFSQAINPEYYSEFFPSLCGGRIGGFFSVLEKSFTQLYSYQLQSLNVQDLHRCFFICMDAYFNYLKLEKHFGIVPSQKVFEVINSIHFQYPESPYLNEITDTVLALTGLAKPQHIYSHLIYNIVKQTENMLELIYKNQAMPMGSTAVLAQSNHNSGDTVTLLKY